MGLSALPFRRRHAVRCKCNRERDVRISPRGIHDSGQSAFMNPAAFTTRTARSDDAAAIQAIYAPIVVSTMGA